MADWKDTSQSAQRVGSVPRAGGVHIDELVVQAGGQRYAWRGGYARFDRAAGGK